jgi:hypothetical protein
LSLSTARSCRRERGRAGFLLLGSLPRLANFHPLVAAIPDRLNASVLSQLLLLDCGAFYQHKW